jgi:multiple sugar transport system ATP-binding protein
VRAEDIAVTADQAPGADEARVLVVEPMGSETLLTLEYRGQRLVARVAGDARYEPGQSAWITLPPDRTLSFDATGQRL